MVKQSISPRLECPCGHFRYFRHQLELPTRNIAPNCGLVTYQLPRWANLAYCRSNLLISSVPSHPSLDGKILNTGSIDTATTIMPAFHRPVRPPHAAVGRELGELSQDLLSRLVFFWGEIYDFPPETSRLSPVFSSPM